MHKLEAPGNVGPTVPKGSKPYRVICISVYVDELEKWDAMVQELKARGFGSMNRSALLREAVKATTTDRIFARYKGPGPG